MSMSQEEIESLMNGLDLQDDSSSKEEESASSDVMSEDDINNLISETQETSDKSDDNIDELLNAIDEVDSNDSNDEDTDIDDIIKELEESEVSTPSDSLEQNTSVSNDDIDELLASIDGIKEEDTTPAEEPVLDSSISSEPENGVAIEENVSSKSDVNVNLDEKEIPNIDEKIDNGVFPLPAEEDTKVVTQLSAVANDSEEKATKIFDVLSNILDYNNNIQSDMQKIDAFNKKQIAMLTSLSSKFPNIEVFKSSLEEAKSMNSHLENANTNIDSGNNEIFTAMELMQFHDINRQKIERVMSVIRKLSSYLNNLFEDDGSKEEVAVAKYIHGDSSDDLVDGEDLEALISEFNK